MAKRHAINELSGLKIKSFFSNYNKLAAAVGYQIELLISFFASNSLPFHQDLYRGP